MHNSMSQKRLELVWQDTKVPRVRALVQELLMSLFITVFNHEEDGGRYTAESFADLPTQDPVSAASKPEPQVSILLELQVSLPIAFLNSFIYLTVTGFFRGRIG